MRYYEFKSVIFNLFENRNQYLQMLDGLVKHGILEPDSIISIVGTLRSKLRRNDRIVWWLHWYRIFSAHRYTTIALENASDETEKSAALQVFKSITKKQFSEVSKTDVNYFVVYWKSSHSLEHINYLVTAIPPIEQLVWDIKVSPNEMFRKIELLEREYTAQQSQQVDVQESDEIVLDYGNYAWIKLNRGACDAEGKAMGHCGNVPSVREGDRILSFRSKLKNNKQKPHLTFILHKDGYLGEMKGRANEKPSEKYHSYIVDLLSQDFVKGIRGGGYAADQNFELNDLDRNTREKLIKFKPMLGQLRGIYGLPIDHRELIDKLLTTLDRENYIYFSPYYNKIYAIEFIDVEDIGNFLNDRVLENLGKLDIFDGEFNSLENYFGDLHEEMIEDILKNINPDIRSKITQYLQDKEGFNPDEDDLAYFINESDSEIRYAFFTGARNGWLRGMENKIYENVTTHLETYGFVRIDSLGTQNEIKKRLRYSINSKWIWGIDADDILKFLHFGDIDDDYFRENFREKDFVIELTGYSEMSKPDFDWDNWDLKAAVEYTEEELEYILER
jgi:hypothetical protein